MCLAVPGRILSVSGDDPLTRLGRVDFGGIVKEIDLAYVPEAAIGDHVLVHVGFAITVLDETEAARVFEHLREIGDLIEEEAGFQPAERS
jgi:hydrogenase expression/formation protein HypC